MAKGVRADRIIPPVTLGQSLSSRAVLIYADNVFTKCCRLIVPGGIILSALTLWLLEDGELLVALQRRNFDVFTRKGV